MKKYISLMLSMVLMLTMLAACGGGDEGSESEVSNIEVGIVLPTRDETRWIQDEASLSSTLENAGFTSEVKFSEGSTATELSNVEDLIEKGMRVLILCSPDVNAAGAAVKAAKDADVQVICYDRLVNGTADVDYLVTFNSYEVGKIQGQFLIDKFAGKKDVPLYLYAGDAEDGNAFMLFAGAWSVLSNAVKGGQFAIQNCPAVAEFAGKELDLTKNHDDMEKILRTINTKWDAKEAAKLAEANLNAEKKGDVAILAPNDDTARALSDVFAANKEITSYVITGQDAELASLKYIQDGKQSMTVRKNTEELAAAACKMADAILKGQGAETNAEYDNGAKKVPALNVGTTMIDTEILKALVSEGVFNQDEINAAG